MHKSKNLFFNKLEDYADNICTIDPVIGTLSYANILKRIQDVEVALGGSKKLIFLEANSTTSTVIAYLGALRAGHAVYMCDPCKTQDNKKLIEIYKPNYLIKTDQQNWHLVEINKDKSKIADNLVLLLATSGSTGSKKLVKITYNSLQANTNSINEYLSNTQNDRAITSLKLHYSYGMSVLNTIIDAGGSIVLSNKESFDFSFWENISRHNITCFSGVPHHFKTFARLGLKWQDFDTLRYVTQAGGKLSPDVIKKQAKQCLDSDKQFFVMYGQTEASPRMSYLPPKDVIEYAQCIGVPVPRGAFNLLGEDGNIITKNDVNGELVYIGENIMSGYALSEEDLSFLEDIKELRTGDLAYRNAKGYYTIIGRQSRFIKPFGIRVNLDDAENVLQCSNTETYVVGNDEKMLIIYTAKNKGEPDITALCKKYNLPESIFITKKIEEIPLLPNGKIDYKTLEKALADHSGKASRVLSFFKKFIVESFVEFFSILFTASGRWHSILDLYIISFANNNVSGESSFVSLGGDSLKYIEVSLGLEKFIKALPKNWHEMSINELERIRNATDV